jgi:hypothetical protein
MASGISIDSGSEFNGIEFISSPDDIPELFIDVILLPEQFNEIKNQVSEHSSLGVSVGLMCFAKQSFNIPSKLFPDEIFLYDVGKYGIDRACITEFINVTNTPSPPLYT